MFSVHCPRHRSRVLLTARDIEAIDNTADGVVVRWRCSCGERGHLRTGRGRAAAPDVAA